MPLADVGGGSHVAGVRFRAWQPWSALHPTIPAHGPLNFEFYDRWAGRGVGGCGYHVHHPGGRSYEDPPVNANAAESRRLSRFFSFGQRTPTTAPPPAEHSTRYRATLDLRQPPARRSS